MFVQILTIIYWTYVNIDSGSIRTGRTPLLYSVMASKLRGGFIHAFSHVQIHHSLTQQIFSEGLLCAWHGGRAYHIVLFPTIEDQDVTQPSEFV